MHVWMYTYSPIYIICIYTDIDMILTQKHSNFLSYYSDFTECPLYTNERQQRNVVDLAKVYICMYIYVCGYININKYVYSYICIFIHICMNINIYMYVFIDIYL
jgi:hypothetical protein